MGGHHSHSHGQAHGHAHGGHHHHGAATSTLVGIAFWINFSFMVVEFVGGLWTNSLALMSDAGHMATDVMSLGLTWATVRMAGATAKAAYTYGYRRAQVLAALADAVSLGAIIVFILIESVRRLITPEEVRSGMMILIAAAGLVANFASAAVLSGRRGESLNIRGAWLHLVADSLGSVAAIVAAAVIHHTGWLRADPVLSLGIGALIAWSAWGLLRDSVRVLMERAPSGLSVGELGDALREIENVEAIHDLHVWELDDGRPIASVHVVVGDGLGEGNHRSVLERCGALLKERFRIEHVTIQIEASGWNECGTNCN